MEATDNLDDVFNDVPGDNSAREVFNQLQALDNEQKLVASKR
jgi:hypothetical protein